MDTLTLQTNWNRHVHKPTETEKQCNKYNSDECLILFNSSFTSSVLQQSCSMPAKTGKASTCYWELYKGNVWRDLGECWYNM